MGTSTKNKENLWKKKAIDRGKELRQCRQREKRQKARAEKWKCDYNDLKTATQLSSVKRHKYPLELMMMAIWMNISCNVSLRGVSKSLCKLGELYGLSIEYISPTTIRNWCLKYGMYCLLQPIKKGRYALILDESVEIGKEHLMVLLVVPIGERSLIEPLKFDDVQVLDLCVKSSWKATDVVEMIKNQKNKHGIDLVYGISDKGNVLRKALMMCDLTWVSDCTHEIANQVKRLYKKDEQFNGFIKQLNALRAKWIMSKNNFYVPPGLRSKSRFHQILTVHKWAEFILKNWATIPESGKEQLIFVKESKQLIEEMACFQDLIEVFTKIFKGEGIQVNSLKRWKEKVSKYQERGKNELSKRVEDFIESMNDYLERQQMKFDTKAQILCCSDVIESMFGKYKNKGGAKIITDDVLKIAGYSQRKDLGDIRMAIQNIKIRDIIRWKKENTILSKLALMKRMKKKSAA